MATVKTASKSVIQKTAEATGDLIVDKVPVKLVSRTAQLPHKIPQNQLQLEKKM